MENTVLGGQFKLIHLLYKGRHCQVYHCISIKTGNDFAVKIQPKASSSSLLREGSFLTLLQTQNNMLMDYGLPTCLHTQQNNNHNAIVETLLGSNLSELLKKCQGMFKINTFLMVAEQMLKRLEFLHTKEYIHRSLNLKKWAIGGSKKTCKTLYIVGLGKCKHYIKNGVHIPYSQQKPITNSDIMYASINSHLGIEPSRRDDLQSMLYCWAKMLYGRLPWESEQEVDKILSRKIEQRSEILLTNFPQPLIQIGKHVQQLSFGQDPDYQLMRNLLLDLYQSYKLQVCYNYDWEGTES